MFGQSSRFAVYTVAASASLLVLSIAAPRAAFAQPTTQTAHVVLRAGTAGAPFDTASVITDFDADGAPDVAIADRTIRNGSHYKIEVRLSSGSTQTVSFLSTKGALRISALDLDNDHDQDLIVTPVFSREVVGVWVNDGTGHFARGRDAPYRSPVPTLESTPTVSGSSLVFLPVAPGRRLQILELVRAISIHEIRNQSSLLRTNAVAPNEGFLSSASSRGPPPVSC